MERRSTPVPRYFIFSLEDGTWVVQRGSDRVQELLTGNLRSFSSLDITYEIEDMELDMMVAQDIVDLYDSSYVWLIDNPHSEINLPTSTLERPLGTLNYFYVWTDLSKKELKAAEEALEELGQGYEAGLRFDQVIILNKYQEPFALLSDAEHAHILVAPILQNLAADSRVETVTFNMSSLPLVWSIEEGEHLIRKFAPRIKPRTVVCIDDDLDTHEIIGQVLEELGVTIISAYTGKEGITLIEDTDPIIVLTDLQLPDIHGYEVVAFMRRNPELAQIPVIVISALDSETDRTFAFSVADARDFLSKPINPDEFRRRVWHVLNQHLNQ
jgi:CheY-like chemotaxis protein